MIPIKRIMAAVDLSHYSRPTLTYACYLARSLGATLIVVNVINQRDVEAVSRVAQYAPKISVEGYIKDQKQDRTLEIQKILEEVGKYRPEEIIIKVGIPFSELMETVKEKNVDLVVMGAKGRSDLATIILGSTSEKMIRRSPVPVIIIKDKHLEEAY